MNNTNKVDIFLDVDHVWQEDPEHHIPPSEGRKICAIAAMKMMMDYLPPHDDKSIKLAEIREWMLKHDGLEPSSSNWRHSKQVEYFTSLGYIAWRRNWRAPSQDTSWFEQNEDYNKQQMFAVNTQVQAEANIIDNDDKVKHSFIEQFKKDCPVIISVKLGFNDHGENHQIVLNGYKNDTSGEYFYIVDPILHPNEYEPRQKITTKKLFKYFNYFAVFAQPTKD